MGVDHYLMGRVYTANNRLMAEVLLYDIRTRQLVLRRTVDGPLGNPRFLAHRIADATMLQLKGIEGIFTTKIAYVSEQVPGVKEIAVMDADGFAPTQLTRLGRIATMPTWGSGAAEIYFTSYHGNRAIIYGMQLNLDPSSYTITPGRQWTIAPYGGTNHSPAWSPAARRIAMVLSKDGNSEIYTVLRDGQDLRRVTRTPATEGSPVWSPDGRRIAFTSNEAGGVNLYMMNADGSGRTAITSGGGWNDAVAWSPDGTRLAFVRRQGGRNDIYTFDVLSGSPTGLRRLTQNEGNNESPTWAPNSRHIAFTSDRSGTWQIYLMLDDGSSQRAITKSGRNKIPRWSPQLVR
jgi:TolB protein